MTKGNYLMCGSDGQENSAEKSEPQMCKCHKWDSVDACKTCNGEKYIGKRADTELLLRIAREELAWHNERATNIINRSTFWLTFLGVTVLTSIRSIFFGHHEHLHTITWPFLLAALIAFGVAAWQLRQVVSLITVTVFDTNSFTRFVQYFKDRENIYCAHCFSIRELLSREMPDGETRLESAEKEADKRASHYQAALTALTWGAVLVVLALASEIVARNFDFSNLLIKH